jgi:hypothetical protein
MNTVKRVLSRIACFANCHPRVVLALTLASVVAVVGLGVFGAVSLFTPPILPKLLLFAIVIAALIAMPRAAK